ncbi:MAG: PHB depolymerase family esterase [Chloroflexota bacterium]
MRRRNFTRSRRWLCAVVLVLLVCFSTACGPVAPTATALFNATPSATTAPISAATLTPRPTVNLSGGPSSLPPQPRITVVLRDVDGALTVEGSVRTYWLHLPPPLAPQTTLPLVLVLHGIGGTAYNMLLTTQMNLTADANQFIVAYLDGSGSPQTWHADERDTNDVAFVRQLIVDLPKTYRVDPRQIFVVGYDSGATLAYRLALELPGQFAGLAAIAGAMSDPLPAPSRPVAVLAVNSVGDPQTPYERAKQSVTFWAQANGCAPTPQRQTVGGNMRDIYTGCGNNASVVFYSLTGNAHAWPPTLGAETPTNDVLWNFFTRREP